MLAELAFVPNFQNNHPYKTSLFKKSLNFTFFSFTCFITKVAVINMLPPILLSLITLRFAHKKDEILKDSNLVLLIE